MDFLRECASRLDAGDDATAVMEDLRKRYSTLRCVNVKACLVRGMCSPTDEYRAACNELLSRHPELQSHFDSKRAVFSGSVDRTLLSTLPNRCNDNVRRFTISRNELRECKRVSARNAIVKNKFAERVNGRELLRHARMVIQTCVDGDVWSIPELTFALMLVTGRRECEILNGHSTFEFHTEYSMTFHGQAKKRGSGCAIVVPVLTPSSCVDAAMRVLRKRQNHAILTNTETSRRYQSYLSRYIADTSSPWRQCRKVHSLRGCYACMVSHLFDWRNHSTAFVTMCILGHSGLNESLVYTPFNLGRDFSDEPSLGDGHLTEWTTPEESQRDACDHHSDSHGEEPSPQ